MLYFDYFDVQKIWQRQCENAAIFTNARAKRKSRGRRCQKAARNHETLDLATQHVYAGEIAMFSKEFALI